MYTMNNLELQPNNTQTSDDTTSTTLNRNEVCPPGANPVDEFGNAACIQLGEGVPPISRELPASTEETPQEGNNQTETTELTETITSEPKELPESGSDSISPAVMGLGLIAAGTVATVSAWRKNHKENKSK
jgi:hypothetical protein